MDTTGQLISGYTAYTDAKEFGATATSEAPATSPFFLASSPECIQFSAAASAASITATVGWGC